MCTLTCCCTLKLQTLCAQVAVAALSRPALQITKLLIIPCVCLLEMLLQHKKLTLPEALSIATVVTGVGIV